jgi:hypothetical protein
VFLRSNPPSDWAVTPWLGAPKSAAIIHLLQPNQITQCDVLQVVEVAYAFHPPSTTRANMASSSMRQPSASRVPLFSTDPTSRAVLARRGDVDETVLSYLEPKELKRFKQSCAEASRMIERCALPETCFVVQDCISDLPRWRREFPSAVRVTVLGLSRAGLRSLAGVRDLCLVFGQPTWSKYIGFINSEIEPGDWSCLAGVRKLTVDIWEPRGGRAFGGGMSHYPIKWTHAQDALAAAAPSLEELHGKCWSGRRQGPGSTPGVVWSELLPRMTRLRVFTVATAEFPTMGEFAAVASRLKQLSLAELPVGLSFQPFSQLRILELRGVQSDFGPLATLTPTCTELRFSWCGALTADAAAHLRHVRKLVLTAWTALTDEALEVMQALEEVDLTGVPEFTGSCFARLLFLWRVRLDKCFGITDAGLSSGSSTITHLALHGMFVSDHGVGALTRLESLQAEGCPNLEGTGLKGLTNLRSAALNGCNGITDAALEAWAPTLQELTVTGCPHITDAGVEACTRLSAQSRARLASLHRPFMAARSRRGRGRAV